MVTFPVKGAMVGGATERADVDSACVVIGAAWLGLSSILDGEDVELKTNFFTGGGQSLAG